MRPTRARPPRRGTRARRAQDARSPSCPSEGSLDAMEIDEPDFGDPGSEVAESIGPIQLWGVAFEGNQFRGEILPELERLKRDGIVRIIDLLFVRKDSAG